MNLIRTATLLLLITPALPALTISLTPPDGAVFGTPGQTVGWGFSLTGDPTNWLLITSVQSTSPIEDVLSAFVGSNSYALAPALLVPWTEAATPGLSSTADALARFQIPLAAVPGSTITGTFLVTYDLFDANPFVNGNFVSSASFAPLPFSVRVDPVAAVPEPATLWLSAAAGLALLGRARQRHRAP